MNKWECSVQVQGITAKSIWQYYVHREKPIVSKTSKLEMWYESV